MFAGDENGSEIHNFTFRNFLNVSHLNLKVGVYLLVRWRIIETVAMALLLRSRYSGIDCQPRIERPIREVQECLFLDSLTHSILEVDQLSSFVHYK